MARPTALAAARSGGQLAPTTDLASLMQAAVERGSEGVDMLERLLAMQERQEARAAEQAFARAMTAVHAEMPDVVKTARNDHTRSVYARLEDIDRALRPVYTAHGFAVMFAEQECKTEGWFRLTCTVMHEAGHSVTTFGDFPHDTLGPSGRAVKSALHGKGSTLTYGRRYLLCGCFNVTPVMPGGDRDGNPPPRPAAPRQTKTVHAQGPGTSGDDRTITDAQRRRMWGIAKEHGVPEEGVRAIVQDHGYESTGDITRADYDSIIARIEQGPPDTGAKDAPAEVDWSEPEETGPAFDGDVPQ